MMKPAPSQNRTTTIEEENDTLTVSKGDRTFEVTEGNETTTIGGTAKSRCLEMKRELTKVITQSRWMVITKSQ